jgi:hypothetical protein
MHKFELQAVIFVREFLDTKAALFLRPADVAPRDQALGTARSPRDVPEERAAQPLNGTEEARGKPDGTHSERWEGV